MKSASVTARRSNQRVSSPPARTSDSRAIQEQAQFTKRSLGISYILCYTSTRIAFSRAVNNDYYIYIGLHIYNARHYLYLFLHNSAGLTDSVGVAPSSLRGLLRPLPYQSSYQSAGVTHQDPGY